jgi:flagellar protein FlaG
MVDMSKIQSGSYLNTTIGNSPTNNEEKQIEVSQVTAIKRVETEKTEHEDMSKDEMRKRLQDAVERANKNTFLSLNNNIKFGFHENAKEMFVSVIDAQTNKKIRQMPSEEALSLLASMKELVGQIFDTKG